MFDLIIIGGGPAGVSAGIYAGRKKLNTLIISKDFSGQVGKAFTLENYPGIYKIKGMDLSDKFKKHLEKFMVNMNAGEEVVKINKKKDCFEVKTTEGDRYFGKSIIIASGANPRHLKIPGEKELLGKGVSYCTICDAPLFREKIVAVIGGGNSGVEAALDLTKYAKKIYIIDFASELKADEAIVEQAQKDSKIEIICSAIIKGIKGDKKVEAVFYQKKGSKKEEELPVEGVFVQIGYVPTGNFAKGLVEFNEKGEIKIDYKTNQTKTKGVFAAGDVSTVLFKQVIIAAGEGAKAALSAYNYLGKK
jgi:NADH-dependent peroxiredoxin subunit F